MSNNTIPQQQPPFSPQKRKSIINRFIHNNMPSTHSTTTTTSPPIVTDTLTDLGLLHHPDPLLPTVPKQVVNPPSPVSNASPASSSPSPPPPLPQRRSSFRELISSGAVRLARSLSPSHEEQQQQHAHAHHSSSPTGRPGTPSNTFSSMLLGPFVHISSLRHSQTPPVQHPFTEKYGKCERGCIGKGATAVVRVAHKSRSASQTSLSHYQQSPISTTTSSSPSLMGGGMVSQQNDYVDDQVVAIKEFRRRRKHETEREYLKKVTAEFCISSSLHHVNVVQTLDLIQDEHKHWCEVMEFCPGGDLFSAIQANRMTQDERDCYFKQLIAGVAYLHRSGVAHRDLKPENLLLDAHGRLKITDFGVSEVFKMEWEQKPHLSEGLCGSAPYIAPEVYTETRYDARKLDIWACGIIYYAMQYHGIPWRQASPTDPNFATYLHVLGKTPNQSGKRGFEALDQIGNNGCDLMYKILDPDPITRCSIESIVDHPWYKSIYMCHAYEEGDKSVCIEQHHPHVHHTVIGEVSAESAASVSTKTGALKPIFPVTHLMPPDMPPITKHAGVNLSVNVPNPADFMNGHLVNPSPAHSDIHPATSREDGVQGRSSQLRNGHLHHSAAPSPISKIEIAVKNLLHHRQHPPVK